jgi:uncharacterized membrane protein
VDPPAARAPLALPKVFASEREWLVARGSTGRFRRRHGKAAPPEARHRKRRLGPRAALRTGLPVFLTAGASVGYAVAAIYRHDRYGSNAYDLGIFDQTVWGYSRFHLLPNTILRLPNALGDHFHPILMALAPLYWIWDDARVLLVAQAVLLALAGLPLFAWAREHLGLWPAACFQAAYLVFWGVLGGDLFDFHELAVAAPIVSVALYALLERRTGLLLACVALGLLTREDLALTFAAFGVFLVVVQRRWRLGLGLVAFCLGAFAVLYKAVIPALAGGRAYSHWSYPALGSGPGSALKHLVLHPVDSARVFVTPATKRTALVNLFVPWLGLPLLSPLVIVMLPTLGARFFSNIPSYWAQGFHYSLVLAPMLGFAAADSTVRLRRVLHGRAAAAVVPAAAAGVVLLGLYFTFGRLKPLDELKRYATGAEIAGIDACLATIPPNASVAATSALVPHLSHRRRIYVLDDRPVPRTQVIAIDLATWVFPRTPADLAALTRRSQRNGYGIRCSRNATVVLEQGVRGGRLSPELRRVFARV